MRSRLTLRPVKTPAEYDALVRAAGEDSHNVLQPSHYAEKGGEVVGCLSVGPTVWWWLHSRKCDVRDSLAMFQALETLQRDRGIRGYVILLPPSSPYNRVVEQAGFRFVEPTQVFFKEVA